MSKLLFAIHGMGENAEGWAVPIRDTLNALAGQYEAFAGRPAPFALVGPDADLPALGPDTIALVPVRYDGVFDVWRQQLGASVDELRAFVGSGEIALPEGAGRLLDWLDTAPPDERHYFWAYALDVLLYRYTLKAGEVRVRVMQQIAGALGRAMAGGSAVQASVLAHSLGTAVAHDSLATLGTDPLGNPPNGAFRVPRLFHSVWMMANVSRILQSDRPVYQSIVCPVSARATGYTDLYVTARHALDPIPLVEPFAPEAWGSGFADLRLTTVRDFNVHAFEHYLGAPQVHVPLLNNLFGMVVPEGEFDRAVQRDSGAAGPPCVEEVKEFVHRAAALVDLFRSRSVLELAIGASQFMALVARMRQACGALAVLLLFALTARAQPALRDDCDAQRVQAQDVGELPVEWQPRHPNAIFARYAEDREAGQWRKVFQAEQARIEADTVLAAPFRAPLLRQLGLLVAEVEGVALRPDSATLVATAAGVGTTRFTIQKPSGVGFGEVYRLFPGTPDSLALTPATPPRARRAVCWAAIGLEKLLVAYGETARARAVETLDRLVAQWDAFNQHSYSMYPWELAANSLGRRRVSLAPPRRQLVLLHPSVSVGVAGWPPAEAGRVDLLALEVAGLLAYNASRRDYRGASLLVTLPAAGGPGGGALVHLSRTIRAGYAFRLAASDPLKSGTLVVSLDLYKALMGVPEKLRDLRTRAETVRDEVLR